MNTVFEDAGGPVNKTEFVQQELYVVIANYLIKDLLIFGYFDPVIG